MSLSAKVKTSLDETRTLMLGAQLLLGFQFHAAFQQRFDDLPPEAKGIDALALGERQPLAAVFGVGQRLGSRYFAQLHGSKVSIWRIG